jgi:hypothetical protein
MKIKTRNLILLASFGIMTFVILMTVFMLQDSGVKLGYKTKILTEKDYKGTVVEDWIKESDTQNGYSEFVYSDPDSWDMFIYYPNINPELKYIKYKVDLKFVDSIVKVYLTVEDAVDDGEVIKDLVLRIQAPLRGAWPTESEVYLNGKLVKCVSQKYK